MEFVLGLPHPADGPLMREARAMDAPVLLSCNAFSRWRRDVRSGLRDWHGFNHRPLGNLHGLSARLDSAGFVAAVRYRGWPWTVAHYLDLAAAHPWVWFASMDWCVEPEVARDEAAVLDRVAGTVRLNRDCWRGAMERGIAAQLMPVIQGWAPEHYERCLDGLPWVGQLIGVGSMCRRSMLGQYGVLAVLDRLDRVLPRDTRVHLFGLKGDAARELGQHPRVASVDSQAYGVAARQQAMRDGVSKTDRFTATVMRAWMERQRAGLRRAPARSRAVTASLDLSVPAKNMIEARVAADRAELRALHEGGEVDWTDLSDDRAFAMAFLDEPDHDEPTSRDCEAGRTSRLSACC